ncbi:MAG: F0F1 ATP synthase subunit A [Candidatus Acidiferrales bacterium]
MNLHEHWFAALLNHWFGPMIAHALAMVGIHLADPAHPIKMHVAMTIVVILVGMILVLLLRPHISVERPGTAQQLAEVLITNPMGFGIRDLLEESVGHDAARFVPMVGSIGIFILLANLISVIPAFESPTGEKSVPLACAILVFGYYNFQGLRHHGPIGYAKHFSGPVWWIAPLIFPVEIISNSARLLSLTVRLWANIFASELLYLTFVALLTAPVIHLSGSHPVFAYMLGIFPATIPVIFVALHIFVAVVQAFVFTILPAIYIGLATADAH